MRLPCRYEAVEVKPEDLAQFMHEFKKKYAGANVTIPHKQEVMKFLDVVSREAKKIGAVNTIVNKNGKLVGYNTDVTGAMAAIKEKKPRLKGKKAIVLGAGGTARALVYGLVEAGAHVTILNRTLAHAKNLAQDFACAYGTLGDFYIYAPCDLVVNTTSVGMGDKEESPLPGFLHVIRGAPVKTRKKMVVMDIIYFPHITKLLRDAKKSGCRIITGDKMFNAQAAASFKLWTRHLTFLNLALE